LQEFVPEGVPWMHMDIAGSADAAALPGEPAYNPKNFSGRPTRTLVQFIQDFQQQA
jgi:leucyl aminopeptidase